MDRKNLVVLIALVSLITISGCASGSKSSNSVETQAAFVRSAEDITPQASEFPQGWEIVQFTKRNPARYGFSYDLSNEQEGIKSVLIVSVHDSVETAKKAYSFYEKEKDYNVILVGAECVGIISNALGFATVEVNCIKSNVSVSTIILPKQGILDLEKAKQDAAKLTEFILSKIK